MAGAVQNVVRLTNHAILASFLGWALFELATSRPDSHDKRTMALALAVLVAALGGCLLGGCRARGRSEPRAAAGADATAGAAPAPRIGVDLGGVLNQHNNDVAGDTSDWHMREESQAPRALESLAKLVRRFGPQNVFIVSRVSEEMEKQSEFWLHQTLDVCGRTGLPRENIRFCRGCTGPEGKGPLAMELKLTHFIDDRDDNLRAVYEDEAGNAGSFIDRHGGMLLHFARSGVGHESPKPRRWRAEDRPPCVIAVANWDEVMQRLDMA